MNGVRRAFIRLKLLRRDCDSVNVLAVSHSVLCKQHKNQVHDVYLPVLCLTFGVVRGSGVSRTTPDD